MYKLLQLKKNDTRKEFEFSVLKSLQGWIPFEVLKFSKSTTSVNKIKYNNKFEKKNC